MKFINISIALLAFSINFFLSCNSENSYEKLTNVVNRTDSLAIDKHQNIAIFVFTGADCISCNNLIDAAFDKFQKSKICPSSNNIILMKEIRPIEIPLVKNKFDQFGFYYHFVFNTQLYEQTIAKIKNDKHHSGGFVLLAPNGNVIFNCSIKEEQAYEKLTSFTK